MSLTRTPLVSLKEEKGIHKIVISNGANNCLNNDGLRDLLISLTDAIAADDLPILIMSNSRKAFCMGYTADCRRITDKMHIREAYSLGTTIARTMLRSRRAIISAVDGYALGLGLEIALCSDLIISTERSKFGMPEIAFGIPSLTGILPEVSEKFSGKAYSLIRTGKIFSSSQARDAGIVTEFLPEENFSKRVVQHSKKVESRLFRIIKSSDEISHSRSIVDDLFFKIYDPTCLTMSRLDHFRNSL